ncbi:MAG TPA: lysophospholipid acyltransferase family protein [Pyrinomonadaceae bacterium]|nr:lysophospholipid acyltransferase family protein [Pyrinomonadaceae bacterium]
MFWFIGLSLGLYALWFVGAPFAPNKVYWRQFAFRSWGRLFANIANMKIEVRGTPPRPPFFLVCNHLSYSDIPAICAVINTVFVAKGEVESWFVAGRIVRDMGTIFINRENRRDIPRAGAKIIERVESGEGVIVFPEGTSTKGEEVLPFNSSFLQFAAKADLPVHYAAISYETPEGEPQASDVVSWWEDISFMAHLWRLFHLRGFTAIINFSGAPVQNPNRKELARELREKVEEIFTPVI